MTAFGAFPVFFENTSAMIIASESAP